MGYSTSSLNTYMTCQKKYAHTQILHTPKCQPDSPHLTFGSMAHEVLCNAGRLRDDAADGVADDDPL